MTTDFTDRDIEFDNPIKKVPKASIHKSGNLGFNKDAQKQMDLGSNKAYKVGFASDSNEEMYLLEADPEEEMTISPSKAGDYFYLNLRDLFKRREIPYQEERIRYDIIEGKYEGKQMWLLRKRPNPTKRKSKKESE